jgi:hypothetical protein
MRPILTSACLLAALGYSASAVAEITITRAEHVDGILIVQGETSRSNQLVTLDKRYRTRTGRQRIPIPSPVFATRLQRYDPCR